MPEKYSHRRVFDEWLTSRNKCDAECRLPRRTGELVSGDNGLTDGWRCRNFAYAVALLSKSHNMRVFRGRELMRDANLFLEASWAYEASTRCVPLASRVITIISWCDWLGWGALVLQ
jgi:hypothetical protein